MTVYGNKLIITDDVLLDSYDVVRRAMHKQIDQLLEHIQTDNGTLMGRSYAIKLYFARHPDSLNRNGTMLRSTQDNTLEVQMKSYSLEVDENE